MGKDGNNGRDRRGWEINFNRIYKEMDGGEKDRKEKKERGIKRKKLFCKKKFIKNWS